MTFDDIMAALEALGTERTKKVYISQGAHEPLFGVATGAMKPIVREVKINQPLAEQLYATGNYDAMYLAGMLADPKTMRPEDFDRWMAGAYFYMLSDYVVAVTLAETGFAQDVADKWIASGDELKMSAGWSCYCWLIGNRPDDAFAPDKLAGMLDTIQATIHTQPERTKYAMNGFISAVGVSFLPLHDKALAVAEAVGKVSVMRGKTKCSVPVAADEIRKAAEKGRLGFKRKNVRC